MNEEQLIEFINWLPAAVPEFKNANPEQIVQALNQMYESEEGQQMLSQLFTAFQESKADAQSQMFKKGGKLGQLVEKAKKGKKMCCKKKEVLKGGMANKIAEKMQEGGELATNTSANTLSNFGLIPKAQDGLSLQPEVKPSGILGWFWKPTYQPRVDATGYEGDTPWTGERATYYKPNGDLVQILTKNYAPGNKAETRRTIKNPFTPIADTTTRVYNQHDTWIVPNEKFNEIFKANFDKKRRET